MNINKSNNTQPPQNEEDENTIQNITEGTIANFHCWGFGKYGQVGKQFISYSIDPIYIQIDYENQDDDIFQLYCGENHSAILTFNSILYLKVSLFFHYLLYQSQ